MTPKERMGAFLTGQPLDRVPIIPLLLNVTAPLAGINVREHTRNGRLMGQAHVAAWRRFGQDMITVFTDTAVLAEAMGTKLHYYEDDAARVDVPVVREPADVDRLLDPDPWQQLGMKTYLEAVQHCNAEVGDRVFVGCCFAAPFTTAACLRGTDRLCRDVHKDPGLAVALLEASTAVGLKFIDACAEIGGVPAIVDPVGTGSVLSLDLFERFAQPYIVPQIERIHSKGFPALLHICGKTHRLLEAMADTGADILSLDVVDLADAKRRVGHRVTLMGNVSPSQTLLEGTPGRIEVEVIDCLRKAGDSPRGFILSTGCEVPLHAPAENIAAFMAAGRRWGRLPLELPS